MRAQRALALCEPYEFETKTNQKKHAMLFTDVTPSLDPTLNDAHEVPTGITTPEPLSSESLPAAPITLSKGPEASLILVLYSTHVSRYVSYVKSLPRSVVVEVLH